MVNVKPLILAGLIAGNEHEIMLSLLAKQGRMNSRTAEQGKRARPHPEASPYTGICGSGVGVYYWILYGDENTPVDVD